MCSDANTHVRGSNSDGFIHLILTYFNIASANFFASVENASGAIGQIAENTGLTEIVDPIVHEIKKHPAILFCLATCGVVCALPVITFALILLISVIITFCGFLLFEGIFVAIAFFFFIPCFLIVVLFMILFAIGFTSVYAAGLSIVRYLSVKKEPALAASSDSEE